MAHHHYIAIGGGPLCDWLCTAAGADMAGRFMCGHSSKAAADRDAKAIRPRFRRGAVKVVPGKCPHMTSGAA